MRRTALQNHSADGFGPQIVQWKEEAASEPVFVKGTEFAAFRPPEAQVSLTNEDATVGDLQEIAAFLQHLEGRMEELQAEGVEATLIRQLAPLGRDLCKVGVRALQQLMTPQPLHAEDLDRPVVKVAVERVGVLPIGAVG